MPQISIFDATTGETITRDYNAAELAQLELDQAQATKDDAAKVASDTAKQVARQTVLNKLNLSADEASALLG
jgi:hypothetical protein